MALTRADVVLILHYWQVQDGNRQLITAAWAIVQNESEEAWTWFLQEAEASCLGDFFRKADMTVISDRDKGLAAAVKKVFPEAWHRYCLVHILRNIIAWTKKMNQKHGGTGIVPMKLFWQAALAKNVRSFNKAMEIIKVKSYCK